MSSRSLGRSLVVAVTVAIAVVGLWCRVPDAPDASTTLDASAEAAPKPVYAAAQPYALPEVPPFGCIGDLCSQDGGTAPHVRYIEGVYLDGSIQPGQTWVYGDSGWYAPGVAAGGGGGASFGVIGVPDGGTGNTTFPEGGILVGNNQNPLYTITCATGQAPVGSPTGMVCGPVSPANGGCALPAGDLSGTGSTCANPTLSGIASNGSGNVPVLSSCTTQNSDSGVPVWGCSGSFTTTGASQGVFYIPHPPATCVRWSVSVDAIDSILDNWTADLSHFSTCWDGGAGPVVQTGSNTGTAIGVDCSPWMCSDAGAWQGVDASSVAIYGVCPTDGGSPVCQWSVTWNAQERHQ